MLWHARRMAEGLQPSFFSIKFKKTTSNIINSTVPIIIAEKDTRSSSFHYEWHLQYKLVSIYNQTQVALTI